MSNCIIQVQNYRLVFRRDLWTIIEWAFFNYEIVRINIVLWISGHLPWKGSKKSSLRKVETFKSQSESPQTEEGRDCDWFSRQTLNFECLWRLFFDCLFTEPHLVNLGDMDPRGGLDDSLRSNLEPLDLHDLKALKMSIVELLSVATKRGSQEFWEIRRHSGRKCYSALWMQYYCWCMYGGAWRAH